MHRQLSHRTARTQAQTLDYAHKHRHEQSTHTSVRRFFALARIASSSGGRTLLSLSFSHRTGRQLSHRTARTQARTLHHAHKHRHEQSTRTSVRSSFPLARIASRTSGRVLLALAKGLGGFFQVKRRRLLARPSGSEGRRALCALRRRVLVGVGTCANRCLRRRTRMT